MLVESHNRRLPYTVMFLIPAGPFYLMVEYCEFGALKSFLRECRLTESFYTDQHQPTSVTRAPHPAPGSLTPPQANCVSANDLLSFAWQIAKGMQYLSTMKVFERYFVYG